jgi:hypothetical protein
MPATRPQPFVFVLMPFSSDFDDTYRLAIKPACEHANAYAERVDEQIFEGSILQRIYNQISRADIIVADLTGRNPNVFYETGYAHALGKRTLLLTKTASDIPFDLKHFPHIIYEGKLTELLRELEKRIRWYLENPAQEEDLTGDVLVRVQGVSLLNAPVVQVRHKVKVDWFSLRIEIQNNVEKKLKTLEFQVGVISPDEFKINRTNSVALDKGQALHLLGGDHSLLPGSWHIIDMTLRREGTSLKSGELIECAIRVFTPSGFFDFPFAVEWLLGNQPD